MRRRGQPAERGTERRQAICRAVFELLGEVGYHRMTMDAIAAYAKASKATIYRMWPDKLELVAESLRCEFGGRVEPAPISGSLRGDLLALLEFACREMDRFYDAHLYFANWGARILMLRLPAALLDLRAAREYCDGESVSARRSGENIVLRWYSGDEDGEEDWVDAGPGPLGALVGVRAELAAGDLRPLYLGWLAALSAGEFGSLEEFDDGGEDGDVSEPAVPAGLDRLTGAQRALADFLRVDADLLDVAAEASAELGAEAGDAASAVDRWIRGLTSKEKDAALRRLLSDDDPHARAELLRAARPEAVKPGGSGRTVRALLEAAAVRAEAREREHKRQVAADRERREQQARRERERRLDELTGQGERPWAEVNALIAGKTARHYQAAVALLTDLRDVSRRGGDAEAFVRRLADLLTAHQRKPALIERLGSAGLL